MLFDIIHLLTGDSDYPPSLDSMVGLYVEKRRFEVEQVAWYSHYVDRDRALAFVAAYEALPEASRLHLLLSPASYEAVHEFHTDGTAANLDALIALARDEAALADGSPQRSHREDAREIWSPMGDELMRRTAGGWERRSAARLDGLVVLDFDSPQARSIRPSSPMMYRPAEDFSDAERAVVTLKFERALGYVDEIAPTFGRLIRNYTRAIRLRKVEKDVGFSSEHVTDTIGEIRIMNAHKDEYGPTRLAEALVHESVHNLLSTYEYLNQPFVFTKNDKQYRPVSAWTGNPIPVPSFCHAVFVWFALFHFAQRELQQPGLNAERRTEIQRRRNHYASGFMIPTPLFDCVSDLALFDHGVAPALETLQSIVRAFVAGEATLTRPSAEPTRALV